MAQKSFVEGLDLGKTWSVCTVICSRSIDMGSICKLQSIAKILAVAISQINDNISYAS